MLVWGVVAPPFIMRFWFPACNLPSLDINLPLCYTTLLHPHYHMNNNILASLLTEALTSALKDTLTPIIQEATKQALEQSKTQSEPQDVKALVERIETLEERLESLDDELDVKIGDSVEQIISNGSWDISFNG